MSYQRANPFDVGTAERVLYDRYRKASGEAEKLEREANLLSTEAQAKRDATTRYATALKALGVELAEDGSVVEPTKDEVLE